MWFCDQIGIGGSAKIRRFFAARDVADTRESRSSTDISDDNPSSSSHTSYVE